MADSPGNRTKQFSKQTADTIHYTCNGLYQDLFLPQAMNYLDNLQLIHLKKNLVNFVKDQMELILLKSRCVLKNAY